MFKRIVDGVISAIKLMVNGRTQLSMEQTQQEQPGANSTSVQIATTPHKSTDAQVVAPQKPKRKPKVAQQITAEALHKQTQNPVLAVLGQGGLQRQIRASKTLQPAKQTVKQKHQVAQSIKAAQSLILEQVIAQTLTEVQHGETGKPKIIARKTPQRATVAQTKKAKAVASTTPVKKRTKKQTPAQTRTVRQSKVRGS